MEILYAFIIIATALGCWKTTNIDQDRKTENASLFKLAFVTLLLGIFTFIYVKSYRVATFKNKIEIKGVKVAYKDEYRKIIKDTIQTIFFTNLYNGNEWERENYNEHIKGSHYSGFFAYFILSNDSSNYYSCTDNSYWDNLRHYYKVNYEVNEIPSLFRFSEIKKVNSFINQDYEGVNIGTTKGTKINNTQNDDENKTGVFNYNYISTSAKNKYDIKTYDVLYSSVHENVNTLNIFSLADLSQCNYEIEYESNIVIKNLAVGFDIPIQVNSLDPRKDEINSEHFLVKDFYLIPRDGKHYFKVHLNFPTQSNLQLIRSLVLTTILTALFTIFLRNLYYYLRKRIMQLLYKYKKDNPLTLSQRIRIKYFWTPIGKGLAWLFILNLFIYFCLLVSGKQIYVMEDNVKGFILILFIIIILEIVLIFIFYYIRFKKIQSAHIALTEMRGKTNEM